MKQINDIQKLIEEKAERKFNTDYFNTTAPIQNSDLFKDVKISCKRFGSENLVLESVYWAFREGYGFYEQVKEKWLPIYIEREAAEFVKSVEQLQNDVQNLLESQSQDY